MQGPVMWCVIYVCKPTRRNYLFTCISSPKRKRKDHRRKCLQNSAALCGPCQFSASQHTMLPQKFNNQPSLPSTQMRRIVDDEQSVTRFWPTEAPNQFLGSVILKCQTFPKSLSVCLCFTNDTVRSTYFTG